MPNTTDEQLQASVADLNVAEPAQPGGGDADDGDVVDPWNVTSTSETGVDYDKLISKKCKIKFNFIHFKSNPLFFRLRTLWLI